MDGAGGGGVKVTGLRELRERLARPLKNRVWALLERGTRLKRQSIATKTYAKILGAVPAFWYFVDHPEIEPTDNTAEQEIRHGVMFRRTSQGTQSVQGSQFASSILAVRATLRKQQRSILGFVVEACRARLFELNSLSLLQPDQSVDRHVATASEAA